MQGHELDSLLLGVMYLFDTCRHLVLRTAVDDHRVLGTKTFSGAHRIHGGVTTSDDSYVLTVQDRCIGVRIGGIHQVDTGQVLVARHHTVQVLTRDVHETRQTSSRTDEDALEALLFQLFDREGLTDDSIGVELYTEGTQTVDLDVHDAVRQTELGDTILEHTTYLMQRFEHMHLVAVFGRIAGEGQTRRTTTNYCNLRCCSW